jgi:hypothetical protein
MTTCSAVLIFAAAVSYPALAAEPQPGLWNQTMTMDMSGMALPQMPAMPPEVLAQMQAAGIQMPNMDYSQPRTTTNQYCITPEEIANREPFGEGMDEDCQQQNFISNDQGMSADLVCTGRMNGTGRIEYVFDSATHYTGSMTFEGTMEGRQANMTNMMEGSWVSADCGNVAP